MQQLRYSISIYLQYFIFSGCDFVGTAGRLPPINSFAFFHQHLLGVLPSLKSFDTFMENILNFKNSLWIVNYK